MAVQQNTDHIETTHIGSLPRPHKTEVHPTVVWEKFKAMRESADLATKQPWN
jgi:hypothetical protein